jgi:hypothetical protein
MRGLSAAEVLAVWERGCGKRPVQRALELYSAACPDESRESLAQRSVGQRDAALLDLREATLGARVQSVMECPSCGEKLELSFNTNDLRAEASSGTQEIFLEHGGYELRLRAPNSLDLAAALESAPEHGADALFHQCLISAARGGNETGELPAEIVELGEAKMAEADPQANVQLAVSCSFCGHRWAVLFDIASFFWTEIEWWAARLLGEVHELASAYGWPERDILALSPARREAYLEAVRS